MPLSIHPLPVLLAQITSEVIYKKSPPILSNLPPIEHLGCTAPNSDSPYPMATTTVKKRSALHHSPATPSFPDHVRLARVVQLLGGR